MYIYIFFLFFTTVDDQLEQASAPRTPPADHAQRASAARAPTPDCRAESSSRGLVGVPLGRVAADEGARKALQAQRTIEQVQQAVERLEDDDAIFGHLVGQDIKRVACRKKSLLKIKIMQLIHDAAYED